MQVSKAIGPFLREEMVRQNVWPTMVPLKHQGKDKMSRGRSMQARTRAHTVRFDKSGEWYQDFEDEVCTFPRAKNDDQFDAFAYLGMLLDVVIESPTGAEIEEEIYLDELRESESDAGRNSWTGY
jgi:phage terminase large subunit-like protein